ncbi:DUF998 domain-containing protein [Actinomycetospora sp. NBRC 106378]|uniref:DUF998 domain-containing protein n=1 Tax=Actinomycetospora sp. NBRC 106378 TaxID=3032208 RepID=UPI0024A284BD|nr:DUF998 domain-containing protein [Actinomycetospora sp. NBRC 106378]GLZ53212.1 hypothetical protein Acsp07_28290 [Actinomycetospora sp. NBRC 106378]
MTATLTTRSATPTTTATTTRRLLLAGAIASPLWGTVALAQAALRSDFDFTVEPLSALSTGSLGWLQITNFVVGGLLTVAGARGLGRTVSRAVGRSWAVSGLGLVAAGALVLDAPGSGTLTWHGAGHLLAGTVSFAALAVTCVLLAGHVRRAGRRGAAVVSVLAAVSVVAGNAWAMTGGAYGSMTLGFGVLAAMLWVSGVCAARR